MKAGIDNRSWTNHRHVSSWRASVPRLHDTGGRLVPASANPPLLLFHFRCRRDCCAGLKLLRALHCYIQLDFSRGCRVDGGGETTRALRLCPPRFLERSGVRQEPSPGERLRSYPRHCDISRCTKHAAM